MNQILTTSKWGGPVFRKLMKPAQKPKKFFETNRWNIVTGDFVEVIEGPQKTQRGKILAVLRRKNRVIIEGVNMRKRYEKPAMSGESGRTVIRPCSIHYSNVMLIDPSTNKPTKIARRYLEDGSKVRVSKASGQIIPKPNPLANRPPRPTLLGPKDTAPAEVFKVTFTDYEKYLPFIYATKRVLKS